MGVATYVKTKTWKDGEAGNTPIYASDLNHIEDGILANNAAIKANETAISELNSNMTVNLLNPTLQTTTRNGVTCTNNGDGTYTLNGTASGGNATFSIIGGIKNDVAINRQYKIIGCPAGGSPDSYFLQQNTLNKKGDGEVGTYDYGNGAILTNVNGFKATYITIRQGKTANNLVFKPMLTTNLYATYDDFVPYTGDTGRLNADVALLKKNLNRRTRTNITNNLSNLSKAVAEQNLEKYGYSIGDYFIGASGYEYTLADMDTYYGGYNSKAVVSKHHIGILINTKQQSKYQESGNVTSYASSTLYSFLTTTVLDEVKSDFTTLFGNWNNHLLAHGLLNNAIGGWGTPNWIENNYIEALTEVQIYGSRVFGADGFQTGTGCKKLTVFDKFRYNQILGNIWIWLRSLLSASVACNADYDGIANNRSVSYSLWVAALILFY